MVASGDGHRAPHVNVFYSSYLLSSLTFRGMLMAASRLDLQAKSDTSILFKEPCSLCASLQLYELPFNLAPVEPQPAQCFYEQSWQSSCCTCMAGHSYSHSMCMCLCSANRSNAVFSFSFLDQFFLEKMSSLAWLGNKRSCLITVFLTLGF